MIQDAGCHYGIGVPAGGDAKLGEACPPKKVKEFEQMVKDDGKVGLPAE